MNNEFTPPRYVMYYEINIYDKDGGIIEINDEQYPIKKRLRGIRTPGRHPQTHSADELLRDKIQAV